MSEVIKADDAMLRGFVECRHCHSYPFVTIKDNHVCAQCVNCGALVDVVGTGSYFEILDAWNEANGEATV